MRDERRFIDLNLSKSKFVNDFLDFQKEHEVVLQRFGRFVRVRDDHL
jgi:uncharacterized protein (DUF924 family)